MAFRSTHTRTNGGVSETEVKELAVIPCKAPEASRTVTTVMPVANLPQIRRNCCFSIRDKAGAGRSGIVVEFTTADACKTSRATAPRAARLCALRFPVQVQFEYEANSNRVNRPEKIPPASISPAATPRLTVGLVLPEYSQTECQANVKSFLAGMPARSATITCH